MKKNLKTLRLSRETVRRLAPADLERAAGANHMTVSRTHDASNCSDPCCTADCTDTCWTCVDC